MNSLGYDIILHLPPKERFTVTLNIRNIRKAKPKIIKDLIEDGK